MDMTTLVLAIALTAAHGISIAAAQTTKPLEVLEDVRGDRIERDKRLERDAAEQQQRDKENVARQEEVGRTPDAATVRGAEGAR